MGKHSFYDRRKLYQKKSPPPKYFTDEILMKPLMTNKKEIMKGLIIGPQGGLVCVDKEAMEKQKGVLMEMFKQLTINMLKGLTISHISLPVRIFEPRSSIHRVVDSLTFAPKYLKQAAASNDHLERLKLVIAFSISAIYVCTSQYKPFNPLLGETL